MASSSDQPQDGQHPKPAAAGLSTKLRSLISRKLKGTVSLESQSGQLISPDGTLINIESLPETVSVCITESAPGHTTFDHTIGTQKSAKSQYFIAFTDIQELDPVGRWILGRVIAPTTNRNRAAKSKYSDNWHNFTLLKILSGPNNWQALTDSNRCINLQLGANWCIVDLTVPVEDLNVTVTTQGDQEPTPIAMSPPRQAQEQEEQEDLELQPRPDPPPSSLPDTVPIDHEELDDIPLSEMFSSVTDKDTSNSSNTSVSLSQSELNNIDGAITGLGPFPRGPEVAQACVSTWLTEHNQLYQTPTPTPDAHPSNQFETEALSTVSSFSHLSSHASDTASWINATDLSQYTNGKFLLIDQVDIWMAQVLTHTANDTTVPAAQTLRTLRTAAETALHRAFASGCLINPVLKVVDTLSVRHAVHHCGGQPVKQFLRALRDTKRQLTVLKALL